MCHIPEQMTPIWRERDQSSGFSEAFVAGQELHVWRCFLDDNPGEFEAWRVLSPDERQRALKFRSGLHRSRFAAGRSVLRLLLAHYAARPAEDLRFRYNAHGKPELADDDLTFSVSHSDGLCVYSIGRKRVHGIDIESLDCNIPSDDLAERVLSLSERTAYELTDTLARREFFLSRWTEKEAYLKALGTGLKEPLGGLDCALIAGESDWRFIPFSPADGYVGTLCVRGRGFALAFRQWA
jgi:4'-phosphopantetheinyl transferase